MVHQTNFMILRSTESHKTFTLEPDSRQSKAELQSLSSLPSFLETENVGEGGSARDWWLGNTSVFEETLVALAEPD